MSLTKLKPQHTRLIYHCDYIFCIGFTEDDEIFVGTDGMVIANMNSIAMSEPESGTLLLSGIAPQRVYEAVCREVYYINTADEPGRIQRTVELTLMDETLNSSAFTTIEIIPTNDPAFFNFTSLELIFNESTRMPINVFSQDDNVLVDPDGNMLQWITIGIVSPNDPNDTLVADVQGTGLEVNGYGGRILNISGRGSFMDYERVLNTVTYNNLFPDMDTTERMVHVFTFDGMTLSFVHNITITVIPYDDPPFCFFDNTLVGTCSA